MTTAADMIHVADVQAVIKSMKKNQDTLVPIFAAMCLLLSAAEYTLPLPFSFLRPCITNLPLLMGMQFLSIPALWLLALIKIIGQGIISGTLFSYLIFFSTGGTIAAVCMMSVLYYVPRKLISMTGIYTVASFAALVFQLKLMQFILCGEYFRYFLPVFLGIGTVMSAVIALFCEKFMHESEWIAEIKIGHCPTAIIPPSDYHQTGYPALRLTAGSLLLVLFIVISSLPIRIVILGAALLLCAAEKQRIQWKVFFVSCACILVCHLFLPSGRVFFSAAGFPVTSGALYNGIASFTFFHGTIYISRWLLQVNIHFSGTIGKKISETLFIFKTLLMFRERLRPTDFVTDIDELLLSLSFALEQETDD